MSFLKHVGQHGDRKVAIVYREVPGEPHMCLVVYTETLNQNLHGPVISCIESAAGQNAEDLAIALNQVQTRDGTIILQKLHTEGMLKKVNTSQVVVMPSPGTRIKLDELNKILDEMKQGEAAVKRMADLDSSRGMQTPAEVAARMHRNNPEVFVAETVVPAPGQDVLGDQALANNLLQQEAKMRSEALGLLAEADRLKEEAAALIPKAPPKATKAATEKRAPRVPKKTVATA